MIYYYYYYYKMQLNLYQDYKTKLIVHFAV